MLLVLLWWYLGLSGACMLAGIAWIALDELKPRSPYYHKHHPFGFGVLMVVVICFPVINLWYLWLTIKGWVQKCKTR